MSGPGSLPRPSLAVRVGITGHRLNKLAPDRQAAVREALARTLVAIEAGTAATRRALAHLPYSLEPSLHRLVSALAEGADRLAVEAAPPSWALSAVLPMPRAAYERDFLAPGAATSASVEEFRELLGRADTVTELPGRDGATAPEGSERDRPYAVLASFLVRQVDVLIAVWDGRAAEGPGGTANVVREALAQDIDVIWIHAERPEEVRLLSGFAALDISQPVAKPFDDAAIEAVLRRLLDFDPAARGSEAGIEPAHGEDPPEPAREPPRYLSEPWPRPLRWTVAYPLLRKLSGAGRWAWPITYPPFGKLQEAWDPFFWIADEPGPAGAPPGGGRLAELRRVLLPRSTWADALASYHGHLYRSAYVTVFVLAGLSVPVGLLYLFSQDTSAILDVKAGFVLAELLIISAVVTLVRLGTRRRWHRTWIETRELSELLRLSRPLACIGALADIPASARSGAGGRDTFPMWYARATIREMRAVPGTLDGPYLRKILRATLETDIREQREYHHGNARNLGLIDRFLHHWGARCFGATIAVLVLYLGLWLADAAVSVGYAAGPTGGVPGAIHRLLHDILKPLVSVLAAGLPALGAALAGIQAQGDFAQRARRSAATHGQLVTIEAEIRAILDAPAPREPSLARTRDILLTAARIMMEDVQAWRQTYVAKALTLPA